MRRIAFALALLVVVGASAMLFAQVRPRLPAAERGRRLAEKTGCFGCHGPEGTHGTANPGRKDGTVPTWTGDLMMYAHGADEVRQWIRDGVTEKRAQSRTWQQERDRGAIRMPAFKHRLSDDEIDDLVAFVMASSDPTPDDPAAAHGLARAEALGCVGCHGPGGRLARRNAGSFKGYIPSWDGRDFADLVRDRDEFGQWVEHGVSERLRRNRFAMYFLRRAVVHMPAYHDHLEAGDLDALWAYVRWLRNGGSTADGE